jgi:integrase
MSKLTATQISKAKPEEKPYKLADGGGLYLLVQPNGAKYWRLKYRVAGKEKLLALGVYEAGGLSLAQARQKAIEARAQLVEGKDPSAERKAAKRADMLAAANTFELVAREYHATQAPAWTAGHARQWLVGMERYALPSIGSRLITEIEPLEILDILRKLEKLGIFETRDRLGQSIGAVFKYAIATGRAKSNPAADIRAALVERPKAKNFACITTDELPAFLRAASAYQGMAKASPIVFAAFRLLMLTAVRTSEIRFAKWANFDLDAGLWVIPAEQQGRKGRINSGARRDHTVLLSTQAVAILRDLYKLTGHGVYAFPNRNDGTRVISENTILKVIEIIGYQGRMTGHGFRSLARTLLDEMGYRFEVLEAMLSHKHESQTVAAYARAQYIEERRVMMQCWADYLDSVEAGGEVIPFKRMAA